MVEGTPRRRWFASSPGNSASSSSSSSASCSIVLGPRVSLLVGTDASIGGKSASGDVLSFVGDENASELWAPKAGEVPGTNDSFNDEATSSDGIEPDVFDLVSSDPSLGVTLFVGFNVEVGAEDSF